MTSETDAEFVADMEWLHSHDREAALPPEKLDRLFALARRGAGLALDRQYDVYAAAREEYRKKIAEQAARIEQLEAEAKTRTLDYLGQVGQLSEEVTRLRAALEVCDRVLHFDLRGMITWGKDYNQAVKDAADAARAALEGKR